MFFLCLTDINIYPKNNKTIIFWIYIFNTRSGSEQDPDIISLVFGHDEHVDAFNQGLNLIA